MPLEEKRPIETVAPVEPPELQPMSKRDRIATGISVFILLCLVAAHLTLFITGRLNRFSFGAFFVVELAIIGYLLKLFVQYTHAPTLYLIIVFKLAKGTLFLTSAFVIYALSDNNLPHEFQRLMEMLRVHPGNRFFQMLAAKVDNITEVQMVHAAIGTCIYSLFSLVEGTGMAFRAGWSCWMAIGESAFFIPLECREMLKNFSWYMLGVMLCNVIIVWYLYKYKDILFRHHHPHRHKQK
jgi:uncharacterized membrane protein (DUF2068 family)